MAQLYERILEAIQEPDPSRKCLLSHQLSRDWNNRLLERRDDGCIQNIEIPGRPPTPKLVHARRVPKRSLSTEQGRQVLLHSIAHIEFNAINLALDAAYRFRQMPSDFVTDWLQVAAEEARHFALIRDYLVELGSCYGAYDAHNGLWDMVCQTRHDVLHRMALVPRVMEARGLDVTPGMMARFEQIGDQRSVAILQTIYEEEIGHVAIGSHWYHYCCDLRNLDAQSTFRQLIQTYFPGKLRGPFNWPARLTAGFEADELADLENCL